MGIQFNSGPMVKRHNYQQNAEMNITPFVDVMLVLLIIFMVAAPLATVDVPVDLPSNSATASPPPTDPVYVSVQANGLLFVQEQEVLLSELPGLVQGLTASDTQTRLFLRGDQAVDYGTLMRVMIAEGRIHAHQSGRLGRA